MSEKLIDTNDYTAVAVNGLDQYGKEAFKNIGKEMFGHLRFKGVQLINETKPSDAEIVAYIVRQLDDGIHPSILEEGEKETLTLHLGSEWYLKWGYVVGDLTEIVTVDRN
jgi:hypothetical protein